MQITHINQKNDSYPKTVESKKKPKIYNLRSISNFKNYGCGFSNKVLRKSLRIFIINILHLEFLDFFKNCELQVILNQLSTIDSFCKGLLTLRFHNHYIIANISPEYDLRISRICFSVDAAQKQLLRILRHSHSTN